jgi:hypothetical protein
MPPPMSIPPLPSVLMTGLLVAAAAEAELGIAMEPMEDEVILLMSITIVWWSEVDRTNDDRKLRQ